LKLAKKILHKFFYALLVLWGVVSVVFFLFNVLPGDPARMLLGQRADLRTVEMIREELGLTKPLSLQYVRYLSDLSPLSIHQVNREDHYFFLDKEKYSGSRVLVQNRKGLGLVLKFPYLGISFQNRMKVSEMIWDVFPNTFILALTAIIIASLIGTGIGIMCAVWKNSWFDRIAIFVSTLGMSLPSFFSAILIGWFFAFVLADYTGLNLTGNITEIDPLGRGIRIELKNLILPALTLGIRPLSIVVQLARNSFLDVLSQDYIRTAKSKGIRFAKILYRHALRNALNPLITAVSGWFASLMAGVVFVEYIFGWKGLGYLIVNALNQYDMPVVLGSVLTIAFIFVVINMLVDLTYSFLDPRVRTS